MPDALTPGDGQDALAAFKRAWEKRDPDAILDHLTEDAEYRFDPFEPPLTGAIAIREYWNDIVERQTHVDFDAERVWVVGRTVLASWHAAYTLRASAERVRERGFMTLEMDDEQQVKRIRQWSSSRRVGIDGTHRVEGGGEDRDG